MMDLRKKIFMWAGIALAVILIFVWVVFIREPKFDTETDLEGNGIIGTQTGSRASQNGTLAPGQGQFNLITPDLPPEEIYVKQLSKIFVERFGSYSNQNDNKHIEDALALSTETMARWLQTQTIEEGQEYLGVTTNVISTSVTEITENDAEVSVGAQVRTSAALGVETSYRTGRVELVRVGNDWKIDGLYWDN